MILGAGPEQVPLIRAAQGAGVRAVVVDEDANRPGAALADVHAHFSLMDAERCIEAAREQRINGVATTVLSLGVRTLGAVAEALDLPGLRRESAYAVTDKIAMRERLAAGGVNSVPFRVARSIEEAQAAAAELGYPLVIKPPDGSGSRGVRVVAGPESVAAAYTDAVAAIRSPERDGCALLEGFIPGDEYGCDGFVTGGALHLTTVRAMTLSPLPYRQELGYCYPPDLHDAAGVALVDYLQAVVRAIGLTDGPFHADVKIDGTTCALVEIGARLPGYNLATVFIPHATGIDPVELTWRVALGHKVSAQPVTVRPTVMRFFTPPPGTLAATPALDDLRAMPGVLAVISELKAGDTIQPSIDGATAQYAGYTITGGGTIEEALAVAEDIAHQFVAGLVYRERKENNP